MRKDYCEIQQLRPRPGGYPEHIMTFKNDENLQALTMARKFAGIRVVMAPWEHGRELYDGLVDAGLMEHTMANIGVPVIQATGPQYVKDICDFLARFYETPIKSDVFDAFCRLEIVSDGCPHCGGELKFVETEGHEIKDGDYYTPNSYVIDKYIYRCAECGEIVKTEKEL